MKMTASLWWGWGWDRGRVMADYDTDLIVSSVGGGGFLFSLVIEL